MEMYTLKTARDKAGYNQKDAAQLLDISPDTLRAYEAGKRFPNIALLQKIETLYQVTYEQLIFLDKNNA